MLGAANDGINMSGFTQNDAVIAIIIYIGIMVARSCSLLPPLGAPAALLLRCAQLALLQRAAVARRQCLGRRLAQQRSGEAPCCCQG